MKFIHLTDLHLVAPGQLLWGLDPLLRFRAALHDIATFHADAEFCVITGDLADRGEISTYEALKAELAAFPIPVHLLLGNHDDRENFCTVFHDGKQAPFIQSAINQQNKHFLFLDTLKGPPSSAGFLDQARLDWLAMHLEASGNEPVYIFLHHPPFDIGIELMDLIKLDNPAELYQLLGQHNITHMFFGHAHRMMSGHWRGIPFSALPSLNHQMPLVGRSVPTVHSDEPQAYSVVMINGDTTVIHTDCFAHRAAAQMPEEAERGTWY